MYSFVFHASPELAKCLTRKKTKKTNNSWVELNKKKLEIHGQVVSTGKCGYPWGEYPQFEHSPMGYKGIWGNIWVTIC